MPLLFIKYCEQLWDTLLPNSVSVVLASPVFPHESHFGKISRGRVRDLGGSRLKGGQETLESLLGGHKLPEINFEM